jgi:hypothetical protein
MLFIKVLVNWSIPNIEKRGSFIPLSNKGNEDLPMFYKFYQTKPAYIELNDHFLSGNGHLYTYILNILRNL